jgi:amidophosphoribosyltransferase
MKAAQPALGRYCDACFTGDYPIPLTDNDAENGPGSA